MNPHTYCLPLTELNNKSSFPNLKTTCINISFIDEDPKIQFYALFH